MRYRPINHEPWDRRLDRLIPDDFTHIEKYPLTAATLPSRPVPVTIGVNWYEAFDTPEKDNRGRWWIGKRPNLGQIRGGHCVCLEPGDPADGTMQDAFSWWAFYDQLRQGKCVGEGGSRMMSLMNRKRYDPTWLWNRAKERDQWPDTNPGDDNGTSVHAAMDVLRTLGHVVWGKKDPVPGEGIAANRWATTADQVMSALQSPASERMGGVRVLNSWGRSYPHRVWMPLETLQRLLDEDGEATVVTDR
jgi:hypothetical protein